MNNNSFKIFESEIRINDMIVSLWSYKFFIIFITFLFILFSFYYVSEQQKVYQASSTFILDENKSEKNDFLSNTVSALGGLANIAKSNDSAKFIERLNAREFILETAEGLDLHSDKFFNSYSLTSSAKDPQWKSLLKSVLGWESTLNDPRTVANANVIKNFQRHIKISGNPSGSLSVNVTHTNPITAKNICNHIVEKIIALSKKEHLEKTNDRLAYLSNTLANAMQDFETAEEALKQFTLRNSAQAIKTFKTGSLILDDLRYKKEVSKNQLSTIIALKKVVRTTTPTIGIYLEMREKHPLLDQSGFRRMLGLSEFISAWTWPSFETLTQVEDSVRDRISALDVEIKKIEKDALKYAESAGEFTKLTRELKISEAAYTVLIEQVKSQSLVDGYTPDQNKIIALADTPTGPSHPQVKLILAIGLTSGLFFSAAFALILGLRRGVYFSEASMTRTVNSEFHHKIRLPRAFRRKSLAQVNTLLNKYSFDWPRQTIIEILNKKTFSVIVVLGLSDSEKASIISRIIGVNASKQGQNVALIDLSKETTSAVKVSSHETVSDLAVCEVLDNCIEYQFINLQRNIDWIFSKSFGEILQDLSKKHDLVLLAADLPIIHLLDSSPILEASELIAYAQKAKTKRILIERIMQRGKIRILLHD